jgi:hypothetical protein
MKRTILHTMATALGFTLVGCVVGLLIGLVAPGFYRAVLQLGAGDSLDPVGVGLGAGAIGGFLVGAIVVVIVIGVRMVPELSRIRIRARGSGRLTLAGLLVAISVLGGGLASLRNPSGIGVELWFTTTVIALVAATLVAIIQPRDRRGFAAGFAIAGWCYLSLSLQPESRAQLPTTRLLAHLERHVSGSWMMGVQHLSLETGPFPARQRGAYWEPVVTSRGGIPGSLVIDELQPEFRRIGHSMIALLVAIAGGMITERCRARSGEVRD